MTITGQVGDRAGGRTRLDFPLPLALPPDGDYAVSVDGDPHMLLLAGGDAFLLGESPKRRVTVVLGG